jgi:hypothetical protein
MIAGPPSSFLVAPALMVSRAIMSEQSLFQARLSNSHTPTTGMPVRGWNYSFHHVSSAVSADNLDVARIVGR